MSFSTRPEAEQDPLTCTDRMPSSISSSRSRQLHLLLEDPEETGWSGLVLALASLLVACRIGVPR
jgi:hypothetical protein